MIGNSMLRAQQLAARQAALRSGKTGLKLLDDADQNIGNGQLLNSQVLAGALYTGIPNPDAPRVLNLTAGSHTGQSMTVVLTAARSQNPGFSGPITGIIEFGNGSQTTKIEVDVPIGPYVGSPKIVSPASQPQDSGVVLQVPAGTLRVFFRYDNLFLTPGTGGQVYGSSLGVPLYGPNPTQASPVLVKAFADYFGRHFSKAFKTQYLFLFHQTTPQQISVTNFSVPPFAKSVRAVREPFTSAFTLYVIDPSTWGSGNAFSTTYTIPANTPCPSIPLEGNETLIELSSTDLISAMKLVYEIGF